MSSSRSARSGASLFPPFAHLASAAIEPLSFAIGAEEALSYSRELAPMTPIRAAEFLTGRRCAQTALAACAPELGAVAVPIGPERAPQWPAGIVGSITHTSSWAAAVVARARDTRGLGFDVEARMGAEAASEVGAVVAAAAEVTLVQRALGIDLATAITLIFSAKEALYKCLFPIVGHYFGHDEARAVRVDPAGGSCTLQVCADLGGGIEAGTELDVRFAIDSMLVATGMWLAASPSLDPSSER